MGKKAPKAPDPYQTTEAQGKLNKETAITNANLSHVNQTNPYGSQTWTQTGTNPDGTPIYTQSQTLSDPIQKQFEAQNANTMANLGAQGNLYGQIANRNPMDLSGTGKINYGLNQDQMNQYQNALQSSAGDAATYNPAIAAQSAQYKPENVVAQTAGYGTIQNDAGVSQDKLDTDLAQQRDAYYRQQQAFLDPQWQQQQQALSQQLANSGVVQNSDAYNQAMDALNRQREFAYNNARNQAIQSGGAEQTRLQNMALAAGQFHNQAQQQGFGQSLANAQMQNQTAQQNAAALADAARFNIGNQNQTNQFNAGTLNQAGQYNADANNQMSQFNANLNNQAANQAANMQLANAGQNNAAQAQAVQQLFQLRNQPMNELSALRQGTSVQMPQFSNVATPQMQSADLQGAINSNYQNQLANYNNQQSGLFSLAGAGLGLMTGGVGTGLLSGLGGLLGGGAKAGGVNNIASALNSPIGDVSSYFK